MKAKLLVCAAVLSFIPSAWAGAAPPRERARFITEDGVEIVGDYYPPAGSGKAPAVILLHMYRSDRGAWKPLVPKLHDAGFAVLAIDMRGHGASTQPTSKRLRKRALDRDATLFNDMHRDVAAAYVWLSKRPTVDLSQFGLVGASIGCSIALDYASRDKSVDAVVCLTPGEDYLGVNSLEDLEQVGRRPMLLLATEGERNASDALGKANSAAEVRIVGKGIIHGTHMFGKIDGIEEHIVGFLDKHVRSTGEKSVAASVNGNEYFAIGSAPDIKLDPIERRLFSSVKEARARGLTGPDSPLDGKMIDTADREDRPAKKSPRSDPRED